MCEKLLHFVSEHWTGVGAFGALVWFSFVNALPASRKDWDSYDFFLHFVRGLSPMSRFQQSASPKEQGVVQK